MKQLIFSFLFLFSFSLFGQQKVIDYISNGDVKKIEKWLDKNPEGWVNTLNKEISILVKNGYFPSIPCFAEKMHVLEIAILYKNKSLIQSFLKNKKISGNTKALTSALSKAIIANDLELVKKLWRLGAKLDEKCTFCHTRTNIALAFGNNTSKEMVDFILEHTSEEDIKHVDCSGNSLLNMLAAYKDFSYLEKYYPKLEDKLTLKNIDGDLAFHQALFAGNKKHTHFLWSKMSEEERKEAVYEYQYKGMGPSLQFYLKLNEIDQKYVDSLFKSIDYDYPTKSGVANTLWPLAEFYAETYQDQNFPAHANEILGLYDKYLGTNLTLDKKTLKFDYYMDIISYNFYVRLINNPFLIGKVKEHISEEITEKIDEFNDYFPYKYGEKFYIDTLILDPGYIYDIGGFGNMGMKVLYDLSFHYPFVKTIELVSEDDNDFNLVNSIFHEDIPNLILKCANTPFEEEFNTSFCPNIVLYETIRISGTEKFILPENPKEVKLKKIYAKEGVKIENKPKGVEVVKF